jgi:hypothetical protein
MKRIAALCTLASLTAFAAAGSTPDLPAQYKFSLSVQIEDEPLVAISAALPLGTSHTLQATPHIRFEVEVPATTDYQSKTVVRLIDDSSGKAVVLHSAQTSGPNSFERGLAYAVCHGQVTFYSGAASGPPTCKQ